MKLRRQLILVSLLTLCLPWAGCQYIREMEGALRQGQGFALSASAQAVAARIASEPSLREVLSSPAATAAPSSQIYLHPLPSAAIVDGYDDEWRGLDIDSRHLSIAETELAAHYWAGIHNQHIYLFFFVTDAVLTYHNPGRDPMASGDHIVLYTGNKTGRKYIIRTSSPGNVTARYINNSGHIRQEHRIRGAWREHKNGYQVEIHIARSLAGDRLGFTVVDQNGKHSGTQALSTLVAGQAPSEVADSAPAPFVTSVSALTDAISVFAVNGLRLSVVTFNQWLVAQSGQLAAPPPPGQQQHGLLTWLYRTALGAQHFQQLDQPIRTGRFDTIEVQDALRGDKAAHWYSDGIRRVGRAGVPIFFDNRILGVAVAEQSTDTTLALTNTAFNRLFFYTLLATGLASIGLLSYASWLSLRIRRLSRAADTAIDESGQILDNFPHSAAKDELGDLTRRYGQLLVRLREYTDYLKTLSGKLSHELRTPLAIVRSSLDNLEHEPLNDGAETYVNRAREGARRLSGILTAMSAANRVEQSIKGADIEDFELDALLREVASAYQDAYPDARFTLTIATNGAGYQMRGTPELMVQMLDKLVDNAVDFCPPQGSIGLFLSRTNQQLHLQISNDGPLLPQQMQAQLFDSLISIRAQADAKPHLGLGLYIVRLIIDYHNGQAVARNRDDGSGVIFGIALPAENKQIYP